MKISNALFWVLKILPAIILLQTLYFKFTGHPESVELFTKLGVEPWGRILTGIIELVTAVLLLITITAFIGALLGAGLMSGAIISHLSIIGVESQGDGGQLFILAIITLLCCLLILFIKRDQGIQLLNKYIKIKK